MKIPSMYHILHYSKFVIDCTIERIEQELILVCITGADN